jgi:hypothetical protein
MRGLIPDSAHETWSQLPNGWSGGARRLVRYPLNGWLSGWAINKVVHASNKARNVENIVKLPKVTPSLILFPRRVFVAKIHLTSYRITYILTVGASPFFACTVVRPSSSLDFSSMLHY